MNPQEVCIEACDRFDHEAGLPLYSELLARHDAHKDMARAENELPQQMVFLPEFTRVNERDFPEDYAHENGTYFNECHFCKSAFVGHKRRVTCKVCMALVMA